MKRQSILFAAALAAMSLLCPAARAAGIGVSTDSGDVGGFNLTNMGVSGGVSTLDLTLIASTSATLETVNGNAVSVPAAFTSPIVLDMTSLGGGMYSITGSNYIKTFGTGGSSSEAVLTANLTNGLAPPSLSTFLNLTGVVTGVTTDNLPGYSFALFASGGGGDNVTLTATNFSGGASSFATVISTPGARAIGSGAFSEIAVSEPASLSLLGIGISGLLAIRRFFKRASVA